MDIRPTLLVLAAGMGSRYGGLKQMDPVGPNGEALLDYAVYDAIKAGFGRIVFVIRQTMADDFKKLMLPKLEGRIAVDFVCQELRHLPEGFFVPGERLKPWGTAHAVWVSATKLKEPFAVINADDFYGYRSYMLMARFLKYNHSVQQYAMIGFPLNNTLSEHGAVSRGICTISDEGYLERVKELTHIEKTPKGIVAKEGEEQEVVLGGNEIVSMNMWGFKPDVFPAFTESFTSFLQNHHPENLKAEFYLPEVVNKLVQSGRGSVKVLPTAEKWFGVTFPDDKAKVVQSVKDLIAAGAYPEVLWPAPTKQISYE